MCDDLYLHTVRCASIVLHPLLKGYVIHPVMVANYSNHIPFLMSMSSVQSGISSCNFIADWTIVLGKIPIAGVTLATSQLATTDFLERSHQPGPDYIFPKRSFGKKTDIKGSFQHSWFSKWSFLHHKKAEDTVFCQSCLRRR